MEADRVEEGGGEVTLMALGATGILIQGSELVRKTLVDACNMFNELICLSIPWIVRHCWL